MTASSTATGSLMRQRVLAVGLTLLLTIAIVLNVTAISMTAWVEEESLFIPSELPVAVFRGKPNGNFTREDLNPSSTYGLAIYTGMRAGNFHVCFTLADMSTSESSLTRETCITYRSEMAYAYVERGTGTADGAVALASLAMCGERSRKTFAEIGIPNESLPKFLDGFCDSQGYFATLLQFGAIIASAVAWVAWFVTREKMRIATLATCVGAVLSLATYVLWVGTFTTSTGLGQGASAHCTIAAAVLLGIAALVARFGVHKQIPAGSSPMQPLQPLA